MSESMGLGEADADSRWIGIRRHQAALIILGVGITGDWIIASHAQSAELALGLCVLVAALPTIDGLTIAELLCVTTLFALRSSWMIVQAESRGQTLAIRARGATTVTGFELVHRGRLDLSGTALELSARLVALMKSLATGGETDHVSIHVRSSAASAQTLLTLRTNVAAPEGWREDSQLLRHFLDLRSGTDSAGLLERWSYVRTHGEVIRTFRVRDFNCATDARALLEKVQQSPCHPGISLHLDVLASEKAQRVASRAVHRMGSDSAASSAAGFRRSARSQQSLRRLAQREELVARGEALMRLGVFITVRAPSIAELRVRVSELLRSAEGSGLRVERGTGRQLSWYCFQLPGGPGW
jgi:hypothetical protein